VKHGLLQRLHKFAKTAMVMAILAFVLQGTLISVSQARAAVGAMPGPAVALNGSVHYHDQLAGHVHDHGGDNAQGHVHDGPDHDGDGGVSFSWTIFGASIAVPELVALVRPLDLSRLIGLPAVRVADGVEPGGLIRPPSTLSIA
jgi:hypothetical protein